MIGLDSLYELASRRHIPLTCTVELTAACNLRCSHCYVSHGRRSRLTVPVLDRLFEELARAGGLYLTFTGGEIALRRDLFDIIALARARSFSVELFTSGTLWGPSEWDRVAQAGAHSARVSLYAVDPDVHDAVTGVEGSHARTLATIRGLRQRGLAVGINCAILAANLDEVPRVVSLAQELDVDVVVDSQISWADNGEPAPFAAAASVDALASLFRHPLVRPLAGIDVIREHRPQDKPCAVGERSAFVRSDGAVLPCADWPEPAGNLLESSFSEIWRDSPVLANARVLRFESLAGCLACASKQACTPCPAILLRSAEEPLTSPRPPCSTALARVRARPGPPPTCGDTGVEASTRRPDGPRTLGDK